MMLIIEEFLKNIYVHKCSSVSQRISITPTYSNNRKNQQQLIDFLRSKPFPGGIRPDLSLYTFIIEKKQVDVLVITNHPLKPYYLTSDYFEGKRVVRANYIYTRIGDTNTPISSSADLLEIEHMWRERFHLDIQPRPKMLYLMENHSDWEMDLYNWSFAYHKFHPEYKIEFGNLVKFTEKEAFILLY